MNTIHSDEGHEDEDDNHATMTHVSHVGVRGTHVQEERLLLCDRISDEVAGRLGVVDGQIGQVHGLAGDDIVAAGLAATVRRRVVNR